MKVIFVILVLMISLFGDDEKYEKHHHFYSKDLTYLDLSSDQKEEVKKILKAFQKELKEFRKYKYDIQDEKQKLFIQKEFEQAKFEQLTKNLASIATKIETTLMRDLHDILDKKQREMFVRYIDEWEVE